jgi:hypothetical protein
VVITVVVSFCVKLENTLVWSHAYASLRFGDAMVIQTVRGRKMKKSAVMIWRWTLMNATLIMETCVVREPAGVSERIGCATGRMIAGTSQMKPAVVSKWMVVHSAICCLRTCPTHGKMCLKEAM